MISVVTATWNSYDWLNLLVESLAWYSSIKVHIIVVDNSDKPETFRRPNVEVQVVGHNAGHGVSLNIGAARALRVFDDPYLMFLDVDCHILAHNWHDPFLKLMEKYDFVAGRGVPIKPIRAACIFMKRELGGHDWRASEGYEGHEVTPWGTDVAIAAYQEIQAKHPTHLIDSIPNRYGTLNGEEWCIDGKPLIYHHWHGTTLPVRTADYPGADLQADKEKLFASIPGKTL